MQTPCSGSSRNCFFQANLIFGLLTKCAPKMPQPWLKLMTRNASEYQDSGADGG